LPTITAPAIYPGQISPKKRGELVYNDSGGTLSAGTLVYVTGWSEATSRSDTSVRKVQKADADVSGAAAMYVVKDAIVSGKQGRVYKAWRSAANLNTNGATVGDPVYLSTTAGGWTLTAPTALNARVQIVGRVAVVSSTVGVVEFFVEDQPQGKIPAGDIQGGGYASGGLTVSNATGSSIAADKLVAVVGWDGTNGCPSIALADADAGVKLATFVTTAAIADGATGTVYKTALSSASLNTNAGNVGDPVYLDTTAGGWTLTAPTAANATVQILGRIKVKSATVGQIAWDLYGNYPFSKIGTNEIQDAAVTNAKVDTTLIQHAAVSLTSAQVKALRASPITLVAAPGAGFLIEFVSAVLLLDYGGTNVFTESGNNLAVKYTDGSGTAVSQTIEMTGFIDQSADTRTNALPSIDSIVAKSGCENKALVLHNTSGAEIAGNAGADNVVRVKVAYRVHATGW
jgi:hypothetical protein